jgi:hypothetical protein
MAKKSFETWMKEVDAAVKALCYLSVADLPDCPFYDWYEDGVSPKAAARRVVKNANE